jgi:hypothetical protein
MGARTRWAHVDEIRGGCRGMKTVNVYMQDGRVFKYQVSDGAKAREHAHRINIIQFIKS